MPRTLLLPLLCLSLLSLSGCPGKKQLRRSAATAGPRFVVKKRGAGCRLFLDRSGGLRFCVPAGSRWSVRTVAQGGTVKPFEVEILHETSGLQLLLRKDPLPEDLPRGALSGPWMMRYAEGYLTRRGSSRGRARLKTLHARRAAYLRADVAVWASFPLSRQGGKAWEEVLVLVKRPSTRYLLSLRMNASSRKNPRQLKRFFLALLRSLRLGSR